MGKAHARVSALTRWRGASHPDTVKASRALLAAKRDAAQARADALAAILRDAADADESEAAS